MLILFSIELRPDVMYLKLAAIDSCEIKKLQCHMVYHNDPLVFALEDQSSHRLALKHLKEELVLICEHRVKFFYSS